MAEDRNKDVVGGPYMIQDVDHMVEQVGGSSRRGNGRQSEQSQNDNRQQGGQHESGGQQGGGERKHKRK